MRKISAMYEWSGGTDYRHTCYECGNCIRVEKGKRNVYKRRAYGDTDSTATDWASQNIACKHFNKPAPKVPVIQALERKRPKREMKGQMSLADFLEMP